MLSAARCVGVFVLAIVAFVFVFVAIVLTLATTELFPPFNPNHYMSAYLAVILGIPSVTMVAVVYCFRKWLPKFGAYTRPVCILVAASYFATAVLGVPAIQTQSNEQAVSEYKRLAQEADQYRVKETHPYIATYAALPVLPGVVITYEEYQLAGLYGSGSFNLSVWYGRGVISLGGFPLWIS